MAKAEPAAQADDEEQLNKAIEELRGVLHEGNEQKGSDAVNAGLAGNRDIIMNIPVEVKIVLGSAEMPVSELMELQKGSTVSLDRRIGEPVDVVVNGRRIARGEITVLESDPSRFGIRLTEIAGRSEQE
ncbi:MAG TPA: flagellar motor switch protein FliN [Reyranella sp.]|nr:flagellar motor switch protein FliN [Reyranella sp.]